MNAYPRLSSTAYANHELGNTEIHTKEVIDIITDYAIDMWRYYKGVRLNEEQQEQVRKMISEGFKNAKT